MLRLPFFDRLESANNVLIAGAGGGFDLFSGLPLYFALRDRGLTPHLASYSFTYLGGTEAEPMGDGLYRVDADTVGPPDYFPERHLARWLADNDVATPVWTIERLGVRQLRAVYAELHRRLNLDAILLVDGGTDSLMRGDEVSLGTPAEDVASILAGASVPIENKSLVCLGFGVDRFHGICHAQYLENTAALSKEGGYLGAWSLHPSMPEVARYIAATEYVQERTPGRESVVSASILSALEGDYGNVHRLARTARTKTTLWINPLMSMYWAYDLDRVASRLLYADDVAETHTLWEINAVVEAFRETIEIKRREDIPA